MTLSSKLKELTEPLSGVRSKLQGAQLRAFMYRKAFKTTPIFVRTLGQRKLVETKPDSSTRLSQFAFKTLAQLNEQRAMNQTLKSQNQEFKAKLLDKSKSRSDFEWVSTPGQRPNATTVYQASQSVTPRIGTWDGSYRKSHYV